MRAEFQTGDDIGDQAMTTNWIVAAGSGRARIFESSGRNGPLVEIEDLVAPHAGRREQDDRADAPGRSYDRFGGGRHAMQPATSTREADRKRFAGEIADALENARREKRFDRLYIVAEPALVGLLRRSLDKATRSLVAAEISRNLTAQSPDAIRAHLPDFL